MGVDRPLLPCPRSTQAVWSPPVTSSVLGASPDTAVVVVMPQVPGRTRLDRLPTAGAAGKARTDERRKLSPNPSVSRTVSRVMAEIPNNPPRRAESLSATATSSIGGGFQKGWVNAPCGPKKRSSIFSRQSCRPLASRNLSCRFGRPSISFEATGARRRHYAYRARARARGRARAQPRHVHHNAIGPVSDAPWGRSTVQHGYRPQGTQVISASPKACCIGSRGQHDHPQGLEMCEREYCRCGGILRSFCVGC